MRLLLRRLADILPEATFILAWLGVQCYLFADTFARFLTDPAYASINAATGRGVALAKASAIVINLNFALLIVSMCQITITALRGTFINSLIRLDRHVAMHRLTGCAIVVFATLHTAAHYINFARLAGDWANRAFLSGPGWTGHLMWLLLLVIVPTSMCIRIRQWKFELFWYTHLLAFFLLVLASIHGAFCYIRRDSEKMCAGASTWKWIVGPVTLLILEVTIREIRTRRFTFVSKVIVHQSQVIELQIKKPSLVFRAGQYVYLNCADVSWLQWHPFTLTSAPEEGFAAVHMRIVGDWTRALALRLGVEFDEKGVVVGYHPPSQLPKILLDGPYGTVSENFDRFEVAVCIGAGIGQTPFASILKSMWYSITHPYMSMKLRKIIFYGISRDMQSLSWFLDILKALEQQNQNGMLELHCHMTGRVSEGQSYYMHLLNSQLGPDPITGLRSKTAFGRPDFERLFARWAIQFATVQRIGVFYCGPRPLGKTLRYMCLRHSTAKTSFKFHQETF